MPNRLDNLHILVVDDQMLVRSLLTQTLKSMGVPVEHIHHAVDGATAKRTLDVKRIDIVLCDLQMEPINGMDLLKEIRCGCTMNQSNMPFVFLSGHSERHNILLAAQLHADGFVIKPPKPAELEKKLLGAISSPRPEANPFIYYQVATGTPYDEHWFGERMRAAAAAVDSGSTPSRDVVLADVKPGDVLGADLYNQSGQLLLLRGAAITATQLKALREAPARFGVTVLQLQIQSDHRGIPVG